jgi:hypothetical protein
MAMLLPLPTSPYTYRPLTLRVASAPGDAESCGDTFWEASPSTSPERMSESIFTSRCCRASGRSTPLSTSASYRLRTSAPEPSCLPPASAGASPADASVLFRPGVSVSPRHGSGGMMRAARKHGRSAAFVRSRLVRGARWMGRGKRRVARDQEEMKAAEAAVSHAPACILALRCALAFFASHSTWKHPHRHPSHGNYVFLRTWFVRLPKRHGSCALSARAGLRGRQGAAAPAGPPRVVNGGRGGVSCRLLRRSPPYAQPTPLAHRA